MQRRPLGSFGLTITDSHGGIITKTVQAASVSSINVSTIRRLSINFSDQAYRVLERLSEQTGKPMSEVLRDAIALKSWFEQTRADGGRVLVQKHGANIEEVISV